MVYDPSEPQLPTEALRSTLRYWQGLPITDGIPDSVKIEPTELSAALGFLMLIDFDDEAGDFYYALYGSKIAETSGIDLTGKSVWQGRTARSVQIFTVACYLAARRLKRPIYSVHESPPTVTSSRWHRLILPMGRGGEIKRFLVCNVPILDGKVF